MLLTLVLTACGDDRGAGSKEGPVAPPVEGGWVEGVTGLWTLERAQAAEGIGAIGYARGWEPAHEEQGVLLHRRDQVAPGANLYCSGHAAEAFLIDADGEQLHRWALDYDDLEGAPPLDGDHQRCWRRVRLLPDGDLLAIHGGRALVRMDRDSQPRWVFGERVHHDVIVDDVGDLWTLTRRDRLIPRLDKQAPIVDDELLVLSPEGEVRWRLSLTEALLASRWSDVLLQAHRRGETLHTNSLRLLRGHIDAPGFDAGHVLLCARDLDLVFVVDPDRRQVVWARTGPWRMPHDPRELADGRLLLFDNLGGSSERGLASRVLWLTAPGGAIDAAWPAEPTPEFFTRFCGTANVLPGGNLLVTETGAGRAFERTPDGELVWLFQTPHRAGNDGQLVAALFEVERILEADLDWLER